MFTVEKLLSISLEMCSKNFKNIKKIKTTNLHNYHNHSRVCFAYMFNKINQLIHKTYANESFIQRQHRQIELYFLDGAYYDIELQRTQYKVNFI